MEELFTKGALEKFFDIYSLHTKLSLDYYQLNTPLLGDHIGALPRDSEEFEQISEKLSTFSTLLAERIVHDRRIHIFKLNTPLEANDIVMPKVEIFEPKQDDDIKKLRIGFEHISFYVPQYDQLISQFKKNHTFIKEITVNSSRIAKTEILNLVEIEFRSDMLGEEDKS